MDAPQQPKILGGLEEIANQYDAFLIDQWGVIHDGNKLYPGAKDVLRQLQEQGKTVIILTNSSKANQVNEARLQDKFGITPDNYTSIVSSAHVLKDLMHNRSQPPWDCFGKKVFVFDNGQNADLIQGTDLESVENVSEADVILFTDIPEGQTHLENQSWINIGIERGIPLVTPSADTLTVTVNGVFGGMGAVVNDYRSKGGTVINVGKPEKVVYQHCANLFAGIGSKRVLAIGDQIGSDIVGARRFGYDAALVSTGAARDTFPQVKTLRDLAEAAFIYGEPNLAPNYVLASLQWQSSQTRELFRGESRER